MEAIRVLIVARTQILSDGLSALIRSQPDMELAGAAASDTASEAFLRLTPAVTLIDLDLPAGGAVTAIRQIRAVSPDARIVGLVGDEWNEVGRAALVAGAWSCIGKDRLDTGLPAAIRRSYQRTPRIRGSAGT